MYGGFQLSGARWVLFGYWKCWNMNGGTLQRSCFLGTNRSKILNRTAKFSILTPPLTFLKPRVLFTLRHTSVAPPQLTTCSFIILRSRTLTHISIITTILAYMAVFLRHIRQHRLLPCSVLSPSVRRGSWWCRRVSRWSEGWNSTLSLV